jgi:F-type H+-transporting ATPase subunit delta
MAEKRTLARPYAKAIFEIAEATKTYEKWSQSLKLLALVAANKEMIPIVRDKTISSEVLAQLFLDVCQNYLDESSRNLVTILALKKRMDVLPEIASLFEEMRSGAENTVNVVFSTFIAIDEKEKAEYEKMLGNRLSRIVQMHCEVDKQLLGGYLAKAGNYVIDGSIRGLLTNLKVTMGG